MSDRAPDDSEQQTLDLVGVEPPDDAGAETAARYRYQAEVIARDAIAVLGRGRGYVLCEWHEDAIVFAHGAKPELLSVKYREQSQGAWTLHAIIVDGGVKHLYERWVATGRRARCRVATNAGLRPDAQGLADACAAQDGALDALAADNAGDVGGDADDVKAFFHVLRIECGLPSREHITVVNVVEHMRPALRSLGMNRLSEDRAYEAIVGQVEIASRDRATPQTHLEYVAQPARLDAAIRRQKRLLATFKADRYSEMTSASPNSSRLGTASDQ